MANTSTPAPKPIPLKTSGTSAPKGEKTLPVHGAKTIMVVEDDPFLSNLLVTRFRASGFNVIKAMSGEEALGVLSSQAPPALILLDIILPDKTGFEILESIQADPNLQKAPVIITSNLGQDSDIQRGKELGAVAYLVKAQNSIDQIVSKVTEIVNKSG